MKKTTVVLIVLLVCLSAVSANAIKFSVSPIGFQTSKSTNIKVKSTYGISGEAACIIDLGTNLYFNAGFNVGFYRMEDRPNLVNAMGFVGTGCIYNLGEKLSFSADASIGADVLFYRENTTVAFSIKTGLEFAYRFGESLSVFIGCDATMGFDKREDVKFTNLRVLPQVGALLPF